MSNRERMLEVSVGLFVVVVALAISFLAVKASHSRTDLGSHPVLLTADFDDISGLHTHAPVSIAGVSIGEVLAISLDPQTYRAQVTLALDAQQAPIPDDSSVAIMTEGLLGAKYLSIAPGMSDHYLQNGDTIHKTTSAFVLEKALGQFLFQRPTQPRS